MKLSLAERERRSRQAKAQHRLPPDAPGKLGRWEVARKAAARSAEVRSSRASQLAAEIVERHRDAIESAVVAGLRSKSVSQRLKAAELALRAGMRGEALAVAEHRAATETMRRDELVNALADGLANGLSGAIVRSRLAERTIDG